MVINVLWFAIIVNLCWQTFCDFWKKTLNKNGTQQYLNTFQANVRNVCLSVTLSVVCGLLPAYPSLCRDLEYLLKIRYIILVNLKLTDFWFSRPFFLGRSAILPYVWKNITKINVICVWQHISSSNFYRMCVNTEIWCINMPDVTANFIEGLLIFKCFL